MEVINSFFSNIKDKLTNPFFGTLILVLLVHHWELIYAIFNFDSDCTLIERITFLQNYISENITIGTVVCDFGYALLYMALGFLIVIGTRSIVMLMEHNLMPWITKKIVNKNVVERSLYDEIVREREDYFDQYEEQRKNVRNFSKTIDSQNIQIKEKDKDLVEQSQSLSKTVKENDNLTRKLSAAQKESDKLMNSLKLKEESLGDITKKYEKLNNEFNTYESLFFDEKNVPHYTSIEKFPPEITNKVLKLKKENKWAILLDYINFKTRGGSFSTKFIEQLHDEGLIIQRGNFEEWTPLGKIINKYRALFK